MSNTNETTTSPLFNVQQAAEFLGVNVGTIRRWARSKTLTGLNVGIRGDWRFTQTDLLAMVKPNHNTQRLFSIVGIGASAGGLEAVTQLLHALPTNSGMGFVLVQHLDPTHESILADLLSRATLMPVVEASNDTQVKPNNVYVIPHNKDITINNGVLKLTNRGKNNKPHMPIDRFFRTLAKSQRKKAIGVILSGTATDGTLGLKEIKNHGGVTFAQDKSAKYQGMPMAAIDSGFVDFVSSPLGIANELIQLNTYPNVKPPKMANNREFPEDEDGLKIIFFMLRRSLGIDFRHYKRTTIMRRIRRRMLFQKIKTLKEYITYLKVNSGELESLFDDLLINVTSFFREPETFQFLYDTVFPRLLKNRSINEPIRIWVPACASGEEVYSIAILLSEFLNENALTLPLQIFGTDVNKSAIEKARLGAYSKSDVKNISSKRLARFFEIIDGVYQINKSIRELCIFAPHNVFGDPPFSKLDLISCCNLLIYLDTSLQERILRTFHFALKSGGFLMLGKSETVGASSGLFSQSDKKYRIYIRKDTQPRGILHFGSNISQKEKQDNNSSTKMSENEIETIDIQKEADLILLGHYTPASVVVNKDLEIVQFRGSTGDYLEPPQGKPTFSLIKMAKGSLGFELRSAITKVKKTGNIFKKENIPINQAEYTRYVTIEVIPLKKAFELHYLVLFENTGNKNVLPTEQKKEIKYKRGEKDRRITELEQELAQTREDMRSITEEQEATNEELQTASEEILSSNEELQSINEELETSKEELESTNEELTTVNEELQNRNEQLIDARDYATAIIRTVQLPLLILDTNLRVKTINKAFLDMFQVSEEATMGNLIYELGNGQWNIPALLTLLKEILPKNNYFDNYEITHNFPSIGQKIMLLNARKFFKDGQNILLVIEDITNRRDIETQKDMFIATASHELKTPITSIKGFAQILEKRISQRDDNKDKYLIQNLTKQTERLEELVTDLLNTSKIQVGKLEMNKKKFDIDATVSKIIIDFQYSNETHQIIKEGKINENIFGDQSRIEQVLDNLITNAIKYSPNANKVIVGLKKENNNVIISVQDFGRGIPQEKIARIFERFYRIYETEDMNSTGFGLGLYISSEIVKGHGGKIWVESKEGKGSTFSFSLPLK